MITISARKSWRAWRAISDYGAEFGWSQVWQTCRHIGIDPSRRICTQGGTAAARRICTNDVAARQQRRGGCAATARRLRDRAAAAAGRTTVAGVLICTIKVPELTFFFSTLLKSQCELFLSQNVSCNSTHIDWWIVSWIGRTNTDQNAVLAIFYQFYDSHLMKDCIIQWADKHWPKLCSVNFVPSLRLTLGQTCVNPKNWWWKILRRRLTYWFSVYFFNPKFVYP